MTSLDVQTSCSSPPPTATGKPLACKLNIVGVSGSPSITYTYITSPKQQFSGPSGKTKVVLFALIKTNEFGVRVKVKLSPQTYKSWNCIRSFYFTNRV